MEPLWIDLWVTIEVPREDNCVERVRLVKQVQLLAVPSLETHVSLDKDDNNYMAEVVRIVMIQYDETDFHHTAAWVYCELKKDGWWNSDPAEVVEILQNKYGWETG
jgi:hypothetical protein